MATPRNKTIKFNSVSTYPVIDTTSIINANNITLENVGDNTVSYELVNSGDTGFIEKDKDVVFGSSGGLITDDIILTFVAPGEIEISWTESEASTIGEQEQTNEYLSAKIDAYNINLSDVETGTITFPITVDTLQATAGEPGSMTFDTANITPTVFSNLNDLIDYWNTQINYYELRYKDENSFYLLAKDQPLPDNDPNLPLSDQNFISFNNNSTFTFRVFRSPVFEDAVISANNGLSNLDQMLVETQNIAEQVRKLATPINFFNEIADGNIENIKAFSKFGQNLTLNTTPQVIASFGGTFEPMTSASTLDISSDDNNDGSGTNTGALTILITGIDGSRAEQTEVITLNGTTTVTTSLTWLGVNKVQVLTAGASQTNEGIITVQTSGGSPTIQAALPISASTTKQCLFHVPNGSTSKIYSYNFNSVRSTNGSTRVTVKGYQLKDNVKIEFFDGQVVTNANPVLSEKLDILVTIPGGSVWWFEAFTDASTGRISGRVQQTITTN